MSDAREIKRLLRARVEELAAHLFPNGKREGVHWCVGDITGAPGKSFKICVAGDKAGLWGDFAEPGTHSRNLLDLWMRARNVDFKTALHEAAEWSGYSLHGSNGSSVTRAGLVAGCEERSNAQFDWQSCVEAFTPEHLERLAKWRGYSIELCLWLKGNGLVGLYNGCTAFPVHDRAGNVVAVHYRLQNGSWAYYPKGTTVHPLVIGDLVAGAPVHIFEGYFDAFSWMEKSGERTGIIVTRGAGNGALVAGLIPPGATVYAWKQNDELKNGKRAGDKWLKDVAAHASTKVLWPKTPEQFKDLNEWMQKRGAKHGDLLRALEDAAVVASQDSRVSESDGIQRKLVAESGNLIILPSGNVRLTDTADVLFERIAPRKTMFRRGGRVVELTLNDRGDLILSIVTPSAARSRFEKYGRFAKWVKLSNSEDPALKPAPTIPKELAEALLDSEQAASLLPRISGLFNCPLAVESPDGDLRVIASGYDEQTRLLITGGEEPPVVPLEQAVASIKQIFQEFDFPTPEDQSRAVASLLTPGLKAGGHLKNVVPVDVAEADQSQAGKTYRQKITAAVYNERVNIVSDKTGGVGSVDETFNEQLVAGRPFIQLDNFRGRFDSRHLESFLTADGLFPARVPHRGQIDIEPDKFFISLTSNGVDLRPDMALRSNIISIRKKPEGFCFRQFEVNGRNTDLLEHVRSNHAFYLGCVFAVIREWIRRGRQRTSETRHDRREWCQVLDWIVQHIFNLPPIMGGHKEVQARVSTPGLIFLRQLCLAIQNADRLDASLKATDLYELCLQYDVEIPGVSPDRRDDSEYGRKIVGGVLSRIFQKNGGRVTTIEIDGFQIEREEQEVYRGDGKGSFSSWSYKVTA
jgi:hypothetical protein